MSLKSQGCRDRRKREKPAEIEKKKAEDEWEAPLSSSTSPPCRLVQSEQGLHREATQTDTKGEGVPTTSRILLRCSENSS